MAYGKDIYQIALGILNDRRMRETEAADERRRAFYAMYPRAQEIERQRGPGRGSLGGSWPQRPSARPRPC